MSDLDEQKMTKTEKAKVFLAARSTQHRVILILGVLLILAFLILFILTGVLFSYYKTTRKEMSQMNGQDFKEEISQMKGYSQDFKEEILQMKGYNTNIEDGISQLKSNDKKIEEEISQLKDKNFENAISELKSNDKNIEDAISQLTSNNKKIEEEISQLKDKNIEDAILQLKSNDKNIEEEITQLKMNNTNIEDGISQLKSNDKKIKEEISQLKDKKIEDAISELTSNNKKIEEEISQLKDKSINEEMSKMKSSLSSDIQNILGAVSKQEKDIQNANNSLSSQIQKILGVLGKVTEEVQKISSSNLECGTGEEQYGINCYYMSSSKQSWNASKKDCQDREAHLMVINSEGEMNFLRRISKNIRQVWIGLTDVDGTWRWVDGTPYDKTPMFWEKGQPDDWKGHGQGGGEDCVAIIEEKNLHDNHCSLNFRYVCEKKLF